MIAKTNRRIAFLFLFFCVMGNSATEALSSEKIYQQVLRSTVLLRVSNSSQQRYLGTGWICNKEPCFIVTNRHVVLGGTRVEAFFPDFKDGQLITNQEHYLRNSHSYEAEIVDTDITNDLALVKLQSLPDGVAPLQLAESSASPGSKIHAIGGSPNGNSGAFVYTSGDVRQVQTGQIITGFRTRTIESTLAANYGNSGGAMVNDAGDVVGVITSFGISRNKVVTNVLIGIDVEETRAYLTKIFALLDPQTAKQCNAIGNRHFSEGRYATAFQHYSKAVRLEPSALNLSNRGWALKGLGDFQTALSDFEKSLAKDPNLPNALEGRASVHWQLGKLKESLKDWTSAIAVHPTAKRYSSRAQVHKQQGKLPAAIADFSQSLRMAPNSTFVLHERGLAYMNNGQLDRAFADAKKITELNPKDAAGINLMGIYYYRKNDFQRALDAFRKAVDLAPQTAMYRSNVGDAMSQLNRMDLALQWYDSALSFDPNLSNAKTGREYVLKSTGHSIPTRFTSHKPIRWTTPLLGTWALIPPKNSPIVHCYFTFTDDGRYSGVIKRRADNGQPTEDAFSGRCQIQGGNIMMQRDGYQQEHAKYVVKDGYWFSYGVDGNHTFTFRKMR